MILNVIGYRVPVFKVFTMLDIVKGNGAEQALNSATILKEILALEISSSIKLFTINDYEYVIIRYNSIIKSRGKLINIHLYSDKWVDKNLIGKIKRFLYGKTDGSRIKIKSHPVNEDRGKYITIRDDKNIIEFNNKTPRPFTSFSYTYIQSGNNSYTKDMFRQDIENVNKNNKAYYFIIHLRVFNTYMLIPKSFTQEQRA